MNGIVSISRIFAAGAALALLLVVVCSSSPESVSSTEEDPEALTANCSSTTTKNTYDAATRRGTLAVKNTGASPWHGFSISFDVPAGAHCRATAGASPTARLSSTMSSARFRPPGKGSWGIMLAHGVYPQTHDMLPILIPYLKQNGFVLGTVEDVVCWMFGRHTWQIIPGRSSN
jgi:hypothetical protein